MPLTVERGQTLYRVRFDENTVTEATPYGEVVFFKHDGVPYAIACEGPGAGEGDLPELYELCSGEDLAVDDGFTDNELIVDEDGGGGEDGEDVATPVTGDSEDPEDPEDPEDDEDEYNEDEDEDEDSEDEDAEDGPAPAAAD